VGYVEKPDRTLEAIILQDDRTRVVHMGDVIGKYRVTKVSPDAVEAVEETMLEASAKPEVPDHTLGIIERADGRVDAVVADGEHVRIVPRQPETLVAQRQQQDPAGAPSAAKPRVSVAGLAGEPAGALPDGENVGVVKDEGNAVGRHPAVRRAGETLEVAQGAPHRTPASGALLSTTQPQPRIGAAAIGVGEPRQNVSASARPLDQSPSPTFVFQTLGYIEGRGGQISAIVSENGSIYLVRQGERFADTYRAVSVDAGVVLAVRSNPGWDVEKLLAVRAEPDTGSASKQLYGKLDTSQPGESHLSASRELGMPLGPRIKDFGVDLIDSSLFAALDLE